MIFDKRNDGCTCECKCIPCSVTGLVHVKRLLVDGDGSHVWVKSKLHKDPILHHDPHFLDEFLFETSLRATFAEQ